MDVFVKQPSEVLDYDVDMSEWFSSIPGDDIDSVQVAISTVMEDVPALVAGPVGHPEVVVIGAEPTRFKVWLGEGTDRVDYVVTCVVQTEQHRTKEVEFKIKVRNR